MTRADRDKLIADRELAERILAEDKRHNAPLQQYAADLERQVAALEQDFRDLPSELARPRGRLQELTRKLAEANDEIERLRRAANPGPAVPLEPVVAPGSNEDTVPMPMVWPLGSQAWRTQKELADMAAARRGVA